MTEKIIRRTLTTWTMALRACANSKPHDELTPAALHFAVFAASIFRPHAPAWCHGVNDSGVGKQGEVVTETKPKPADDSKGTANAVTTPRSYNVVVVTGREEHMKHTDWFNAQPDTLPNPTINTPVLQPVNSDQFGTPTPLKLPAPAMTADKRSRSRSLERVLHLDKVRDERHLCGPSFLYSVNGVVTQPWLSMEEESRMLSYATLLPDNESLAAYGKGSTQSFYGDSIVSAVDNSVSADGRSTPPTTSLTMSRRAMSVFSDDSLPEGPLDAYHNNLETTRNTISAAMAYDILLLASPAQTKVIRQCYVAGPTPRAHQR
ncbi:hypothetical protein LTR22_023937 [Elasticomyces elasticus]|nr:hypothetical protein LTR22_023937 [Elasticomyces elasticus]KAK4921138.1 hypothetical protein LTR49_011325 [Elasticomyces elasticus]KAK5761854.1 hypothetical protein LTS12_007917 [Elasticomyces elasticus]